MRISDWSSDVCSSDLVYFGARQAFQRSERGRSQLAVQAQHVVLRRQLQSAMPEGLADDTLERIARAGMRRVALGDDHAQACLGSLPGGQVIRRGAENEESPSGPPAPFQGSGKLRGAMQPRLGRKRGARHERPVRRYAKSGTNRCRPYTARRLRPLARRAFSTARPPRVFLRTRKPWVRLRRVTGGW